MTGFLHVFAADVDVKSIPPRDEPALPSGPRQAIQLQESGWQVVDLIKSFDDVAQSAVVDEIDKATADFSAALAARGVEPALIDLLGSLLANQISAWRRFERATAGYERFMTWGHGKPLLHSRNEAYELFVGRRENNNKAQPLRPVVHKLIDGLNRLTAATLPGNVPCVVDLRSESARFDTGQDAVRLKFRFFRNGDLRRPLIHSLSLGIDGRRARRILIPIERDGGPDGLNPDVWLDPALAGLPRLVLATLRTAAGNYLSARRYLAAFLSFTQRHRFVGIFNELLSASTSGIASALRAAGHPTILINHGSLCVHDEGPVERLLSLRAHAGINSSKNATHLVPRAPYILRGLPDASKHEILRCRFNNAASTLTKEDEGKRPFVILHAGNYVSWGGAAFINPTESEYFQALLDMAAAVESNPALRLEVRIKVGIVQPENWREQPLNSKTRLVDPDQFSSLHPWSERVVPSPQPKFMDALARSDLLVSDGPTATIAEALEAGKPVLFHTLTDRFCHMPARTELPTADDRSAVYWCPSGEMLPRTLEAIRLAHANRPLTETELAPHRWPADSPDIATEIKRTVWRSDN